MQEIGGQMYHVSVVMVEPRKRDIKVSPSAFLFETNLFSLNPSGTPLAFQDISISMTISLMLLLVILMNTYHPHKNTIHLTGHQRNLDEPQNRMLYSHLSSVRL
jgi:hypothetical protein